MKTSGTLRSLVAASALALALAPAALAQGTQNTSTPARSTVASGQKAKLKGAVVSRGADSFVMQDDATGAQTTVLFNDRTSVKTKGGFFGGGTKYALTSVTRGLHVEVEGRGDASGNLVADKVRFTDADLRTARTLEANIVPVEGRVGTAENRISETEQNAQRMSGQLEELAAVSNAAAGGAVAAQETADRAVAGVQVANERINSIDEYTPEQSININFKASSAALTADAKTSLDQVATYAKNAKGFLIEVTGFAYESRNKDVNRRLSQQRAEKQLHENGDAGRSAGKARDDRHRPRLGVGHRKPLREWDEKTRNEDRRHAHDPGQQEAAKRKNGNERETRTEQDHRLRTDTIANAA